MFNMRIDIIRKELDRRFKEVEELQPQQATDEQIEEACNRFLHFLLTEPFIKPYILDLSNFKEHFIKSNPFKQIRGKIIEAVKTIIAEIDKASIIDQDFNDKFKERHDVLFIVNIHAFNFTRHPSIPNPEQYIEELRSIDSYPDQNAVEGLGIILEKFDIVFRIATELSKQYDKVKIDNNIQYLVDCNEKYKAHVRTKASYDGASSLNKLLLPYLVSDYKILSGVEPSDFGKEVIIGGGPYQEKIFGTSAGPEFIDHCRNVYHAVDKFLSTSKSKSFLIDRLLTYCRWIKKEDFPKPKDKDRELRISKIVEEFLFNHGYFPLINFKMGKSIPDILSAPGTNVRWDNSILIELKQSIGTPYTYSELTKNIVQAKQYLSLVKGAKSDIVDIVYLLVFYDGNTPLEVEKSLRDECEKKNIRIELIYVGDKTPSTLGAPKMLKAPAKTTKKKQPGKKAAKRSSGRKKRNA